jgi:hypothetical protein|tara:strand:+ start:3131 stop:3250 length:120 start_codon:yes stop_codon:yes gene_type:complete
LLLNFLPVEQTFDCLQIGGFGVSKGVDISKGKWVQLSVD